MGGRGWQNIRSNCGCYFLGGVSHQCPSIFTMSEQVPINLHVLRWLCLLFKLCWWTLWFLRPTPRSRQSPALVDSSIPPGPKSEAYHPETKHLVNPSELVYFQEG